jgi:hypothetical protein
MARVIGNGSVARISAGLLALGVISWICATIFGEHLVRQFEQDPVPVSADTTVPRENGSGRLADPENTRFLRNVGAQLRSWFARKSLPPAKPPSP